MDKEKLVQRLMATFLVEIDEHVRALNRDLLALEKDAGAGHPELLKTLFRTVHSLKGAARSVSLPTIEAACHRLESLLGAARDGHLAIDPELIHLLFSVADALGEVGNRLKEKRELGGSPLEALLPKLEAAAVRAGGTPSAARSPRSAAAPPLPPASGSGVLRVPAAKLDALLARSGELLVARRRAAERQRDLDELCGIVEETRAEWRRLEKPLRTHGRPISRRAVRAIERTREQLKRLERGIDRLAVRFHADQHLVEQAAGPLEEEVRRVRMLPFGEACDGLERTVRDLAKVSGKEVELAITGADVELDRAILEELRDPLLHLVRNAVDHGVEPPAERERAGKPRKARVVVAAALKGGSVEVSVSDDGRGLDLAAIREQARRRRLTVPDDERELARLIFQPSFSTARFITELSGRGVGLDVVRHRVEMLHGTVDFGFEAGRGTRFALTLPLTLTMLRALLVAAGGQVFAVPATSVRRLVRVRPAELGSLEGREVLLLGGAPVPAASLAEVLGLRAEPVRPGGKLAMVVLAAGDRQLAVEVDDLLSEHDVVVKTLGARLKRVRNFAGATLLPSGKVALILSAADVIAAGLGRPPGQPLAAALEGGDQTPRKRLLVVDDSVTTRSLVKSILEAAGFEVLTAADGAEAWQTLQENGADLVIADVEMPRMSGFQLTEAVRASKRFRDLPVVLVTALETEKDKARGLEVGADAYLPKSTFDQKALLDAIQQLL